MWSTSKLVNKYYILITNCIMSLLERWSEMMPSIILHSWNLPISISFPDFVRISLTILSWQMIWMKSLSLKNLRKVRERRIPWLIWWLMRFKELLVIEFSFLSTDSNFCKNLVIVAEMNFSVDLIWFLCILKIWY